MRYFSEDENDVFLFENKELNCACIIAKNNQLNLPGLGGTRFLPYKNLASAIDDAKLLATSMTLKNIVAGVPFSGAKQIIFCNDHQINEKRNDILFYTAECVNKLNGEFITGTDMGLTHADVSLMADSSRYILSGELGNTSYYTALGVVNSLLEILRVVSPLKVKGDLRILIQGAGKVGASIVELLSQMNMKIFILESDPKKVEKFSSLTNVQLLENLSQFKGDVFMPCAIGGSVSYELMQSIGVSVISGCANNQLIAIQDDLKLAINNIFYAPDFIINSGGTIHAAAAYLNWSEDEKLEKIKKIPGQLMKVYNYAVKNAVGTYQAAKEYALSMINGKVHL